MRSRTGPEAGFSLLEMVCALAIVGLMAAVLLPAIPRQTSRTRLEAYAIETAALLKADRNAAIRRRLDVTTQVDAPSRSLRSGASGQTVRAPRMCGLKRCCRGIATIGRWLRPSASLHRGCPAAVSSCWPGSMRVMKSASTG